MLLKASQAIAMGVLLLLANAVCTSAQEPYQGKILGGYFEEWGIYYAGYNIANLQQNGVADKLTHLMYAFANVTTSPAPACAIADTWADYQTPYLPSVSGVAYTGPMYGNFAAEAAAPKSEGSDVDWRCVGDEHGRLCDRGEHGGGTTGAGNVVYQHVCERQYCAGNHGAGAV
jgi:hypothetical protein